MIGVWLRSILRRELKLPIDVPELFTLGEGMFSGLSLFGPLLASLEEHNRAQGRCFLFAVVR
jgi:hypothetical protein